ncbi:hypothetical protein AB205_0170370, partial [Aquarana catesbeiana]
MVPQEKKELNRETEEPFVCLYSQKYQFKLQISFNYALNTGHFRPEALVIIVENKKAELPSCCHCLRKC